MGIIASPFHKLLMSNDSPTEEDVQNITRFCAEPAERIRKLDVEIANLQERFNSLISNARSLQSQLRSEFLVAEHLAILAPIRRLPTELLQEIFYHCIDGKPFQDICPEGGYASEAPVLFGRVCSRWRTVSFSTPSLW
ncbi:hypothetical protein IW261DRAFT_1341227, partial [Armillaria novae-zelandiae]